MATRQHGLFRAVDRPSGDVAKGGCYIYGSAGHGVDTGVLIDFEGTLFLSDTAIKELAEVAGFSVNEEGQELETRNAELERDLEVANERIQELEADAAAIGRYLGRAKADDTKP